MIIDARGHRCPVPTLRLRKAIEASDKGIRLTLLATDPMARIDAPHLAHEMGAEVLSVSEADGVLTIEIETRAAGPTG